MTPRHVAALSLAEQGIPVFPCRGKIPAVAGGFKAETTDLDQINAWWAEADYNLAVRPIHFGWVAIDLDTYKPDGVSQAVLDMLPATRTHATPHGGLQQFYATADEYGNQKLAVNVDVRSRNGYVMWPPSVVDGVEYRVLSALNAAPLPEAVADALRAKQQPDTEAVEYPDIGLDIYLPGARDYCAKLTDHPGRWQLAATLVRNFGLSDATATALCEEFGLRTEPSGEGTTLTSWADTLAHARVHGRGELGEGVAFTRPAGDDRADTFDNYCVPVERESRKKRFGGRLPSADATAPPVSYWDKHKTLPKGPVVGIASGETLNHKTGVMIKHGLDIVEQGGRVLYIAAEGAHGVRTARLPKAREARDMPWDKLDAAWRTEANTFDLLRPEDHAELSAEYAEFSPNSIFVDVLTKVANVDINTPQGGAAIMAAAAKLATRFDATVIMAHHPGKDASRGPLGSVLLTALADFAWTVRAKDNKVWVHVSKMKDGPSDFSVPYGIDMTHGAPVIVDCEFDRAAKPPSDRAQKIIDFLRSEEHTSE